MKQELLDRALVDPERSTPDATGTSHANSSNPMSSVASIHTGTQASFAAGASSGVASNVARGVANATEDARANKNSVANQNELFVHQKENTLGR